MEYKDMPVDKLLWNTRMYPGCVSASESAAELGRRLTDAQATVEALQRERDEWRSNAVAQEARANDLERDCKDLLSDIDGERAKVGDLLKKIAYWEKRHRTYRELAEENMNLKSDELSALQGLVRALVGTKSFTINGPDIRTMGGSVLYACSSPMSAERLGALLEYRERTLDATTPATKGGDGE